VTTPRLSVFVAATLDGYIADVGGSLDWLHAAAVEGEDFGYDELLSTVDALAMGRGTYDYIAHLDPLPFGDRPTYVFTHREAASRAGVTFWASSPEEAVREWSHRGYGRVYVDGGKLISSFLDVGLIDDLTVTVVPLLLGEGMPLFSPSPRVTPLELESVRGYPSGMAQLRYRRRA
jgi:dihydrofolate reductase